MSSVDSGSGQDFDLNIAPIIDCFTVLITYLLVSASFLSLSVLDIGVAASGEMTPPTAEPGPPPIPPLSLEVFMRQVGTFDIKVTGGPKNLAWKLSAPNEKALVRKLSEVMRALPSLKEANIAAEPTVHYKEMIKLIEVLKAIVPKLFIAGT